MTNNLYILLLFIGSSLFADEPIALITKSIGNAKISSDSKYRLNAEAITPIFYGNRIKTKAKSFAQIVYLDDRSTVSIYPKTEVTINGKIENRMISKHVDVTAGIVRVKVLKQIANEFKLTTIHSELTCHECEFWVISDNKAGDQFYKISGNILVTNPSLIETMELVNDSTIKSLKDTEIGIYQTSSIENKYLELLMLDADEMPVISDKELTIKGKIDDRSHEIIFNVLEIRLKNDLNIEHKIILTYTK